MRNIIGDTLFLCSIVSKARQSGISFVAKITKRAANQWRRSFPRQFKGSVAGGGIHSSVLNKISHPSEYSYSSEMSIIIIIRLYYIIFENYVVNI